MTHLGTSPLSTRETVTQEGIKKKQNESNIPSPIQLSVLKLKTPKLITQHKTENDSI